jgi:hypothetical protein
MAQKCSRPKSVSAYGNFPSILSLINVKAILHLVSDKRKVNLILIMVEEPLEKQYA